MPRKAVLELGRLLSDSDDGVDLELFGSLVRFSFGDTVVTTKIIDGKFPDYTRVVPTNYQKRFSVKRQDLLQSLQRAIELAHQGDAIRLTNNGTPYYGGVTLFGERHSGRPDGPFTIIGNGAVLSGAKPVPQEVSFARATPRPLANRCVRSVEPRRRRHTDPARVRRDHLQPRSDADRAHRHRHDPPAVEPGRALASGGEDPTGSDVRPAVADAVADPEADRDRPQPGEAFGDDPKPGVEPRAPDQPPATVAAADAPRPTVPPRDEPATAMPAPV